MSGSTAGSAALSGGSGPRPGCPTDSCHLTGTTADLPAGVAPGASGVVAANTGDGFFVVDDAPGTDAIDAVRTDGSLIARIAVRGMSARNAEALTAGPCSDRSGRCLLIGDIGDNDETRADVVVYEVAEPSLSPPPTVPVAAHVWIFRYPDRPHNAEAMFAAPDGSLIIVTKSAPGTSGSTVPPHRVYRGRAGGGTLTFVRQFVPPNPQLRVQSLLTGTVVTDAAYSPGRVLLLTYDEVIEYRAPVASSDPAGFPGWPHRELPDPRLIQTEGIALDRIGCGYVVVSEEGPGGTRASIGPVACQVR